MSRGRGRGTSTTSRTPAGPRRHHQHAVGELDGLLDVVRHEQDRLLLVLPDADQVGAHLEARQVVERAEGLVHVEQVGVRGERARDLDALAHAARELVRVGALEAGEADHLDVVRDDAPALLGRLARQPEADVLIDREPGEDAALLEHEDAARVGAADRLALHRAPRRASGAGSRRSRSAAWTCRSPRRRRCRRTRRARRRSSRPRARPRTRPAACRDSGPGPPNRNRRSRSARHRGPILAASGAPSEAP